MPELPEVETIRRQLNRVLLKKIIKSVDVRLAKQVKGIKVPVFKSFLANSKIIETGRRAKMLAIGVSKQGQINHLVFHLKMTGQLIYKKHETRNKKPILSGGGHPIKGSLERLPNKFSHVIFNFKDGSKLFFNDLRQFGWVTLIGDFSEIDKLSATPLGAEPLSPQFKPAAFISCLKNRPKTNIYQALMDQRCVVGVGNIYTNEVLFLSGIRPARKIKNIKTASLEKLFINIRKILKKSVAVRGTTIDDYMDALGDFGNFSRQLKVYQRENKSCANKCGGKIVRGKIAGRSIFFCPKCQK